MVGYSKHETLSQYEKFIAGALSGSITRFLCQPLDVIKVRSQVLRKTRSRFLLYRIARRIFYEEGITAFWHGHVVGQMYSMLAVSSRFYIYELTTRYAANFETLQQHQHFEHFACGVVSGCVTTTLVIPLEVIRVRMMLVKDQYRSIIRGAHAVYRYGGLGAFYEGFSASLLQMGPHVGISFTVFGFVQKRVLKFFPKCTPAECKGNVYKPHIMVIASSIAGAVAGFCAKTFTYPFDLAKRRLQIGCLVAAYKMEGFKGLYRGWTVTIYKAQATSIIAFTTYELICYFTRQMKFVLGT